VTCRLNAHARLWGVGPPATDPRHRRRAFSYQI